MKRSKREKEEEWITFADVKSADDPNYVPGVSNRFKMYKTQSEPFSYKTREDYIPFPKSKPYSDLPSIEKIRLRKLESSISIPKEGLDKKSLEKLRRDYAVKEFEEQKRIALEEVPFRMERERRDIYKQQEQTPLYRTLRR